MPPHIQQELERTRPEVLAEETQRRFLRELQAWQEPEVTRQLEDFRTKRLMGMTPGESELAELDALPTRDPARERLLAEALLGRLEEMHASISPDEEKSSAVVAAVGSYLKLLGVKPKGNNEAKKHRGHFFRKKLPGGRKAEEAKTKRGFSLAGAALWGRDGKKPHRDP
ncbi:rho guanine nucleotide exchange factor 1-like [Coturnix japonica]|uniref:rho guanine nucleotide exchange factor 1-like n=1 Tax=Coturnix japonica TaxID=93934 RepID=UPI000777492B|nr:rho guanine nucleotide exchange factor 1-like [Coturnix japonica]